MSFLSSKFFFLSFPPPTFSHFDELGGPQAQQSENKNYSQAIRASLCAYRESNRAENTKVCFDSLLD